MKFEFYHEGLANTPKLSVDGIVDNAVHFSHWKGNKTAPALKADTSTEIALNLVAAPNRKELTQGIELVTNNHFDTDGVLSVWTVLQGSRALDLRDKLVAAAVAGDFSEFSSEDGVRASIVIQGAESPIDEDAGSPLAADLAGEVVDDEAIAYELVFRHVERVLTKTGEFEALWRDPWTRIAAALESFSKGSSQVQEDADSKVSIVTLAPEIFSVSGFKPTRHVAPFTAISHHARGELFLIATPFDRGWAYRIDYPYYSWAETVVRPPIARCDLSAVLPRLNELEKSLEGAWKADTSELASAAKFVGPDGKLAASSLAPDTVAAELKQALTTQVLRMREAR